MLQMPTEVQKSDGATHSMMIEYATEHVAHARKAIAYVETNWPSQFNYFLFEDASASDEKFEVTVFPSTTDLDGDLTGTLVHSRLKSETFVEEEPVSFLTYIERALANHK